jgi:hypothetical protein
MTSINSENLTSQACAFGRSMLSSMYPVAAAADDRVAAGNPADADRLARWAASPTATMAFTGLSF